MNRRSLYLRILALGAILFLALNHAFPLHDLFLKAQKSLASMQVPTAESLFWGGWGFWGRMLYPIFYAFGNVLLLPCGVLAIGSGVVFGLWWGFLLTLAGNVLGSAIAFGISRKLGRRWLERRFFQHQKWVALDLAIAREGWKIIFLSQVHPLFPTSLLNYLYGVTRIGFWPCMLWVMLGQAPGLFLYAYIGTLTQLGVRVWRGESHPGMAEYAMWLGGLVVALVATTALARLALRLLAETREAAARE